MRARYIDKNQLKNMVGVEVSEKINNCGDCGEEYDNQSPYFLIDRRKSLYLGFCQKKCLTNYIINKMDAK